MSHNLKVAINNYRDALGINGEFLSDGDIVNRFFYEYNYKLIMKNYKFHGETRNNNTVKPSSLTPEELTEASSLPD